MLNPAADELLAPGMVLCIEPAHHDEDVAGCHIENLVVVTDDGAEVLTDYESAWEPPGDRGAGLVLTGGGGCSSS